MNVLDAKIEYYYPKAEPKKDTKKKGAKEEFNGKRIEVGHLIEFDNGMKYKLPNGETVKGKGLRIRLNAKHRTISVQRPDTMQYEGPTLVTTTTGGPIWVKGKKTTGLKPEKFRKLFAHNPKLVALVTAFHVEYLGGLGARLEEREAKKAARLAA